jgi:hypothetical protein
MQRWLRFIDDCGRFLDGLVNGGSSSCTAIGRRSNPKAVPGRLTRIGHVEVGRIVLAWGASE